MLDVRKLTENDRERVAEICSKIWGGEDYLMHMFDGWLADEKGEFLAITDNENIIGVQKVSWVSDNDLWIEGLRKDQDCKIKGVGSFINKYVMDKYRNDPRVHSMRFATYFSNLASISVFEKLGFKVKLYRSFKLIDLEKENLVKAKEKYNKYLDTNIKIYNDVNVINEYLNSSNYFKTLENLPNIAWVSFPYNEKFLKEKFIDKNYCIGIEENGEIKALALTDFRAELGTYISFFDAESNEYAEKLLGYIIARSIKESSMYVAFFVTSDDKTRKYVESMGFKSPERENDFLLYYHPDFEKGE